MKYVSRNTIEDLGSKGKSDPLDFKRYRAPQTVLKGPRGRHTAHVIKMQHKAKLRSIRTATDMRPLHAETNRRRQLAGLSPLPWKKMLPWVDSKYNPAALARVARNFKGELRR